MQPKAAKRVGKKKLKTFSKLKITNPVILLQSQHATKQDSTHIANSEKVKKYFFLIRLQLESSY
jgi:hypothetical protein